MSSDDLVHLRRDGVSVLFDLSGGGIPAVTHWGADLGDLGDADLQSLAFAHEPAARASALAAAHVAPDSTALSALPRATTVLPAQGDGWMGRPGLSGTSVSAAAPGRSWSPRFRSMEMKTGPGGLVVHAIDERAELAIELHFELGAGGVLRARAELTNTGADPYLLNDLVLMMPVPGQARELLDFAGRWAKERTPQRRELVVGAHVREGRHGRTGSDAATILHLGTPGFGFQSGEIWAVHTGWSGNHTHLAERLQSAEQVLGGGELLLPGEIVLGTGQSYTTPWVYFAYGIGLDDVARRFHRWLRARPQHVDTRRPVTLNVWEAVYFDHNFDRLIDLAERAATVGVERYVLDDGWFSSRRDDSSGLGDWIVSPDLWPNGLGPLAEKVTSLGMQFGLWFEPEMVNPDSDVARAHPEWIMSTDPHRWPLPVRNQQVLNLGIPACYAHVRDQMHAILDAYEISYLKWDHNRDLIEAGTQPDGHPGVHQQTLAFYRLVDELKQLHPGLEIESCSSGGSRVDLGVLERTDRIWVSDCIDPLERCQMNRWTAQLVPPELMGSHIASGRSHTTGRWHTLSFRAATALFGHLGVEWDLAQASDEEITALSCWIAYYKANRDLLLSGDLVRVDHPDPTVLQHGVIAADRSRAIFSVTALAQSEVATPGYIRFPGLTSDTRYRIRPALPDGMPPHGRPQPSWIATCLAGSSDGLVLTGRTLAMSGVQAPLLSPEHALLFEIEATR